MYTKNNALSQLITVTGPKSQVAILFSELSTHERAIFPRLKMKLQVWESLKKADIVNLIRPEYKRPSGFFGVRALARVFGRIRYINNLIMLLH